jgi:hypothetical protein
MGIGFFTYGPNGPPVLRAMPIALASSGPRPVKKM